MQTIFTNYTYRLVPTVFATVAALFFFSFISVQAFDATSATNKPAGVSMGGEKNIQAQIEMLMKRIAELRQGGISTAVAKKPIMQESRPFSSKIFGIVQTTKEINIGEDDTAVAKVNLAKSKETRYLNEVRLRVAPTKNNVSMLPWESIDELSAWVGSDKVLALSVNDASKWKTITTKEGRKIYELSVFSGNIPVPANVAVKATLAVSSSDEAQPDDVWTFWVPTHGVTIWTETEKHKKYGPSKAFTYKMVGDDEDEAEDEDEDEDGEVLGAALSLPEAELVVSTSGTDPDATTFAVERSAKSDPMSIFAFTLDSDDSRVNLEVEQIGVHVVTDDKGGASDLIAKACLLVKGVKFCNTVVEKTPTDTIYWFNIGGASDFVITPAERVDVVFEATFKPLARNYAEGTTIVASVKASEMIVDYGTSGELSGSQLSGMATSETHTLYTEGVLLALVSNQETLDTNSDTTVNDDEGIFTLEFEATAFETDVYIPATVARGIKNTAAGVNYRMTNGSGSTTTAGTVVATLTSTADQDGSHYVVHEGETETFTVTVTFNPKTAGSFHGVNLMRLNWNNSATTPDSKSFFRPAEDFETDPLAI